MKKEKFTNEQFENDSLAVFEKLLQGYSKAMQSAAWSRRPNELIEKLTQLPTALFERKLFELFDYRYVIASEDIESLIDYSLQLRVQMEETQRYVHIKTCYFKLPFISNKLKSFKVYNHEHELCYKQTYSLKINWTNAIRYFLKKKGTNSNLIEFKEQTIKLKNLEIYHYSPLLNLFETTPKAYYNFFCDYHGKIQFLKYLETKQSFQHPSFFPGESTPTDNAIINYGKLNQAQKVLWAFYFFSIIGLKPRINVGVNVIIKFLHVTNNLELDNYKNGYFYKLAYKDKKLKSNKRLIFDLKKVRRSFIESGLPTSEIDKEISALE